MKKRTSTTNVSTTLFAEEKIQQEIVVWYNNTYCLLHHTPRNLILSIPNENQQHLTRTGLYPGASDLIVVHHPHPLIWVEVKTATGIQKPNQIKFQLHVESLGYQYYLVRSLTDFQEVIYSLSTTSSSI